MCVLSRVRAVEYVEKRIDDVEDNVKCDAKVYEKSHGSARTEESIVKNEEAELSQENCRAVECLHHHELLEDLSVPIMADKSVRRFTWSSVGLILEIGKSQV